MYRIGLILGPVVFIGAVIEWILRLTHYAELIEKTLPWTEQMTSATGIWITMVVGILIFVAAWAERKKEKDEERKHAERRLEDGASRPQIKAPSVGEVNVRANPLNTVDASQKVEIHNHPPSSPPIPVLTPQPLLTVLAPHNVQFTGVKKIRTDVANEIFDASEGFVGVKACFLNRIIPGTKTRDFDYVRSRIVLRNASGGEIAEITKPKWLAHEAGDAVHIEVNQTECVLLAVFGSDNDWAVPFITTRSSNYWEDGTSRPMIDGCSLPLGELSAEITLVGEDNIGLDPVIAHFSLGPDGRVEIE